MIKKRLLVVLVISFVIVTLLLLISLGFLYVDSGGFGEMREEWNVGGTFCRSYGGDFDWGSDGTLKCFKSRGGDYTGKSFVIVNGIALWGSID